MLNKNRLSRRAVLRGAGVTPALPRLDAMLPVPASKAEAAAAMAPPKRLVAINYGLGFHGPQLFPKQAGGSVLDSTHLLITSNLGNASSRSSRDLPVLLAGGGFRHGQHIVAGGGGNDNTRLCNLFVQIAQRMGVATDRFGSNDGTSVKGLA